MHKVTRKCKRTPYGIHTKRIRKSPYTSRRVQGLLQNYHAGKSVGFTARSSLKSMGLLPRSNGCYTIGEKYKS
jgi:hypothetical protein